VPRQWAVGIIRTTIWCPTIAVLGGAAFDAAGLRPMFVESGGWRLAGLGHPAFLAGVCLPAIYAGLIELWRAGRPRDRVLLGVNLLILILTGARAPLACALAVGGMTLLTAPSAMVSARERLSLMLFAALVLPLLILLAGNLSDVRLFKLLTNDLGNLSGREYLWPSFEAAAAGSPWFGWGLGAGNAIIPPDSPVAQMLHTWAAHNEYLRMEVEGGQAGRALLVLLFWVWAYRHTAPLWIAERRIMRFVFLAFAAHAFTDNVLISTPACVLFAFATAVFARGEHDERMASSLPGAARKA
jgi:O-antigen ligase